MATDDSQFSQVMRGYNREEVDRAIKDLRRELISANSTNTEAQKEIKRLSAQVEELSSELDEVGSPTYSGLGHRLENTLRIAEEQATRLIAQADIDAERLRTGVQADIDRLKLEAADHAERTLLDALQPRSRHAGVGAGRGR